MFAKLKQRLNQGTSWLTAEVRGLLGARVDARSLEALEEALLSADVGVDTTEWLLSKISARSNAAGTEATLRARLEATILELLEPLEVPLEIKSEHRPFVILAVGVNGAGKTATLGKLGVWLKERNRSVLLAAADTFRAAAVEQLEAWGRRAGAGVVSQAAGADPAAVVHDALAAARARGIDVVLADTAGRLHTAAGLMAELEKIVRVARRFDPAAPHEILLVLDASQGQNALAQALEFHRRLGVTGLVLTKLDGTAKGGAVLGIARKLGVPIRFIAVGEASDDFAVFGARDFTRALLGEEPA
ncbi:MAG TPA: signal recognition particle-docking protein FtsY [Gammaproteobacteria bacterium]|jgi:fused signal recognition particle receptor